MFPEVNLIKRKRALVCLTQKDLEKISDIPRSMIVKIESEKIEPSYSVVIKLFRSLTRIEKKNESTYKDIMSTKIFFIASNKKIIEATKKMKELDISRIPIKENEKVVRVVSENLILDKLSKGLDYDNLLDVPISEVIDEVLPIVGAILPLEVLSH